MIKFLLPIIILSCCSVFGQDITGIVINSVDKHPIEFVNIGVIGKNIGTVSNLRGEFKIFVDSKFDNDTLQFSMVGYETQLIKVSDVRKKNHNKIFLKKKTYELSEIVIKPKTYKQKTLGVKTKFKGFRAGLKENRLGYECGILMRTRKTAFLKQVNINVASCSYDTIFYRLNIYRQKGKKKFKNILKKPIYINISKDSIKDVIQIDLRPYNIVVDGNFLVTLENIKDLGEGYFFFCAGLGRKTYCRETSQGEWETFPVGFSISVIADVEK